MSEQIAVRSDHADPSNESKNLGSARITTISLTGGLLTILGTLLLQFNTYINGIDENSRTAISVATQHGDELNELRGAIKTLREQMNDKTAARYTSQDANRDFNEVRQRLYRLEQALLEQK